MSSKKHAKQRQLHVMATLENELQSIVRVISVRGGNLVDVEQADGSGMLCEIPSRFSKNIWMKRGDYLIVEAYSDARTPSGQKESKVKATVVHVLQLDDIKQLKKEKSWPAEFEQQAAAQGTKGNSNPSGELTANPNRRPNFDSDSEDHVAQDEDEEEEEDDDMDLPPNPNRRMMPESDSDDE